MILLCVATGVRRIEKKGSKICGHVRDATNSQFLLKKQWKNFKLSKKKILINKSILFS